MLSENIAFEYWSATVSRATSRILLAKVQCQCQAIAKELLHARVVHSDQSSLVGRRTRLVVVGFR